MGRRCCTSVDPGSDPNNNDDFLTTGVAQTDDFADNRIEVDTWTAQSRWQYTTARHAAEMGGFVRNLAFDDRLNEKSVVIGQSREGNVERVVVDSLLAQHNLMNGRPAFTCKIPLMPYLSAANWCSRPESEPTISRSTTNGRSPRACRCGIDSRTEPRTPHLWAFITRHQHIASFGASQTPRSR